MEPNERPQWQQQQPHHQQHHHHGHLLQQQQHHYHHHQQQLTPTLPPARLPLPLPPLPPEPNYGPFLFGQPIMFPSLEATVPPGPARNIGRPRKYGTPEEALEPRKMAATQRRGQVTSASPTATSASTAGELLSPKKEPLTPTPSPSPPQIAPRKMAATQRRGQVTAASPTATSASTADELLSPKKEPLTPTPSPSPPPKYGSSVLGDPRSFPSSAETVPSGPAKKKGRARKYRTPEEAVAAKRGSTASSSKTSKQSELDSDVITGKGFTPYIIDIAEGEDVEEKIRMIMQKIKLELFVISACGNISSVWLHQQDASGGKKYYKTEHGKRSLDLSVSLSASDGSSIGGKVSSRLIAASPVKVVIGAFQLDKKKNTSSSGSRLPPTPAGRVSTQGAIGIRSPVESSGGSTVRRNDEHRQAKKESSEVDPTSPPGFELTPSQPSKQTSGGHGDGSSASGDEGKISHQKLEE